MISCQLTKLSISLSGLNVSRVVSTSAIRGNHSIPLTTANEADDVNKQQKTSTTTTTKADVKSFDSIPGPKPAPLIGNIWRYLPIIGSFRADKLDETGRILYQNYGPIVREHVFGKLNVVHLFDPNDMETMFRSEGRYPERRSHRAIGKYRLDRPNMYSSGGIFTENGPEWYRLRKISQQSLLNPNNVNSYIPETEVITQELVDLIRENRNNSLEMIDFQYDLYKWSLENISQITMETRFGCLKPNLEADSDARKLIKSAHLVIEAVMNTEIGTTDMWRYVPTRMYRQLVKNEDLMASIVSKVLKEKKDELDLAAKYSNDSIKGVVGTFFADPRTTFGDVLATILDLMLAGIDTTAFSSGFVLYYLTRNPEKQEILRKEIFAQIGENSAKTSKTHKITPDMIQKMPFMKAVVKETMRLAPLSIGIGRVTTTPTVVRNYLIPSDTMVITQNQVACRMAKYFANPDEFLPERWLNLRGKSPELKPHPFLALPFGYGPRSCPGKRISDMNTYVLLIKLLTNFKIEYHHEDIGMVTRLINIPDKPMKYRFIDL